MGPGGHLWVCPTSPHGRLVLRATAAGAVQPGAAAYGAGGALMGLGWHIWVWDGTYGAGMGSYRSRMALMGLGWHLWGWNGHL